MGHKLNMMVHACNSSTQVEAGGSQGQVQGQRVYTVSKHKGLGIQLSGRVPA
jgi:hypothetical protein